MTGPLVVEFAGLPGSGKSSLAAEVSQRLRDEGMAAFTVVEAARIRADQSLGGGRSPRGGGTRIGGLARWWVFYGLSTFLSLPFLWHNRRYLASLARTQSRRKIGPGMKIHIAWWFLQLAGRRNYLDTSRDIDAVLWDDGFVHRSVMLFSSPGETEPVAGLDSYLDAIPAPDVVVNVRADIDTCLRRVVDRGVWKHSKSATRDDLLAYLKDADHSNERAIAVMKSRHGTTVVEVDNRDGVFLDSASAATASIDAALSARHAPSTGP